MAAGAPACNPGDLAAVCREFEDFARAQGCSVCYVCAEDRLRYFLGGSASHSIVTIGAQPVWDPRAWQRRITCHASLRAQLYRCRNKGVEVEAVSSESAAADPELRRVLLAWLATRHLPPMHFLVEPDILQGGPDRLVLVARRAGKAVAYLVASPVPARASSLIELLARSPEAPNGTSELLIHTAMASLAAQGITRVTLGLVALATAADEGIRQNPLWLSAAMRFARLHANRFYNFRGLEQFRTKMEPDAWEPVYAIAAGRRFTPRILYAVGGAFSGISPLRALGLAALKALREELRVVRQ